MASQAQKRAFQRGGDTLFIVYTRVRRRGKRRSEARRWASERREATEGVGSGVGAVENRERGDFAHPLT